MGAFQGGAFQGNAFQGAVIALDRIVEETVQSSETPVFLRTFYRDLAETLQLSEALARRMDSRWSVNETAQLVEALARFGESWRPVGETVQVPEADDRRADSWRPVGETVQLPEEDDRRADSWWPVDEDVEVDAPRSDELVENGDFETGDKTNWSQLDAVVAPGDAHGGTYVGEETSSSNATRQSDDLIPINPTLHKYELSGWLRQSAGSEQPRFYFGIAPYDQDGVFISRDAVDADKDTETVLAVDAEATDTTIEVEDASNWNGEHPHSVAFNIQTDGGDLPNHDWKRLNRDGTPISGNVITLNGQLGRSYPAGTPVREHRAGGTYMYSAASNQLLQSDWTEYDAVIQGVQQPYETGGNLEWRLGTAYAKILFLLNRNVSSSVTTQIDDVSLKAVQRQGLFLDRFRVIDETQRLLEALARFAESWWVVDEDIEFPETLGLFLALGVLETIRASETLGLFLALGVLETVQLPEADDRRADSWRPIDEVLQAVEDLTRFGEAWWQTDETVQFSEDENPYLDMGRVIDEVLSIISRGAFQSGAFQSGAFQIESYNVWWVFGKPVSETVEVSEGNLVGWMAKLANEALNLVESLSRFAQAWWQADETVEVDEDPTRFRQMYRWLIETLHLPELAKMAQDYLDETSALFYVDYEYGIDPILGGDATFARASSAWAENRKGVWREFLDGTLRFTWVLVVDAFKSVVAKLEHSSTNKCTRNVDYNTNGTNGWTLTQPPNAAASLTAVDDSDEILSAGLQKIVSDGYALKLDNSGGDGVAIVTNAGDAGNTNQHTVSAFVRGGGTAHLALEGAEGPEFSTPGRYGREAATLTPAASTDSLEIRADAGTIVYFVLAQLEEQSHQTSPIRNPTTGQVTREDDTLYYTDPPPPDTPFAFYYRGVVRFDTPDPNWRHLLVVGDGSTSDPRLEFRVKQNADIVEAIFRDGSETKAASVTLAASLADGDTIEVLYYVDSDSSGRIIVRHNESSEITGTHTAFTSGLPSRWGTSDPQRIDLNQFGGGQEAGLTEPAKFKAVKRSDLNSTHISASDWTSLMDQVRNFTLGPGGNIKGIRST